MYFKKSESKEKPSILSIVPGFCNLYIPYSESGLLPKPLSSLFNEQLLEVSFSQLLERSIEILRNITSSPEQAKSLEVLTRGQSHSKLWYQYRAGRITASKFKAAVHTSTPQPSQSLIKHICYPESYKFKTPSTSWGLEHEKSAITSYCAHNRSSHSSFTFSESGLVIHTSYPNFGATPDGVVQCICCGRGVVEVKCPFKCKTKSFKEASDQSLFCLNCDANDEFTLKTKHAYYYQLQLQMKLCEVDYGDLVVWRPNELVILRIYIDKIFVTTAIANATIF